MPDHRRDNYRGFFSLLDAKAHKLILTVPFGDIENAPIEKQEKYFQLSQEKANRLYNHARTGDVCMPVMNCTTSMETRDESKESFGGAVRVRLDREFNDLAPDIDLILSFSGRPEICDEAMMLALGHGIASLKMGSVTFFVLVAHNFQQKIMCDSASSAQGGLRPSKSSRYLLFDPAPTNC